MHLASGLSAWPCRVEGHCARSRPACRAGLLAGRHRSVGPPAGRCPDQGRPLRRGDERDSLAGADWRTAVQVPAEAHEGQIPSDAHGSGAELRPLARDHPEEAQIYGDLKMALAERFRDDWPAYVTAKSEFVNQLTSVAIRDSEEGS